MKPNDKLPSSSELAYMFNVSIKTIHDSVKLLSKEGLVFTRRGKYGTIVAESTDTIKPYNYEVIEQKIRAYISSDCKIGDKLPSIKHLAKDYKTSEKTIKKALDNLASDGFVVFSRGRFGGTFIADIPQKFAESYTWLAINSEYINNIGS